mmetsp:Transcript_2584/g.2915  ORF Transcript_2584/g.2915 Transcript_2584/m.2915 type:complete len:664 (+) Transcript_2584:84-2075(+)
MSMLGALANMSIQILTHSRLWMKLKLHLTSPPKITSSYLLQTANPSKAIIHTDCASRNESSGIHCDDGTFSTSDGDTSLDGSVGTGNIENNNSNEHQNYNEYLSDKASEGNHKVNENQRDTYITSRHESIDMSSLSDSFTSDLKEFEERTNNVASIHTHYIFLSHGWLGNPEELGYIQESIDKTTSAHFNKTSTSSSSSSSPSDDITESNEGSSNCRFRVHSSTSNFGKTCDGIENGGKRFAKEIEEFIKKDTVSYLQKQQQKKQKKNDNRDHNIDNTDKLQLQQNEHHVSISFIGFSLGGLYAQYAVSCLPEHIYFESIKSGKNCSENHKISIHSNIFVSAAAPHLGCSKHTFMKIPRAIEKIVSIIFGRTGKDLFQIKRKKKKVSKSLSSVQQDDLQHLQVDDLVFEMATNYDRFLRPLSKFKKRIAYINAFRTDIPVPTTTGAFLSKKSTYPHIIQHLPTDNDYSATDDNTSRNHEQIKNIPSFLVTTACTEPNNQYAKAEVPSYTSKSAQHLIMSNRLDSLGWSKVFIDARSMNPIPSIPKCTRKCIRTEWSNFVQEKQRESMSYSQDSMENSSMIKNNFEYSQNSSSNMQRSLSSNSIAVSVQSKDLHKFMTKSEKISVPVAHSLMVASKKNTKFYSNGRPIMDSLVNQMVRDIMKTG